MKIIKINSEPFLTSGELRQIENAVETINVLRNWYEATAVDAGGNDYIVYWSLKHGVDPNANHDEIDVVDWDDPYMILDTETFNDVEALVIVDDYYYQVEITSLDKNGGHVDHHEEGIFNNLDDAKICLEETGKTHMYNDNTVISLNKIIVGNELDIIECEYVKGYYSVDAAKILSFEVEHMILPNSTSKLLVFERDFLELLFEDKFVKMKELLKFARAIKGLTQQEVADEVGVTVNAIQKYEYGERTPESKILFKLINILDIDQDLIKEALENEE